MARYFVREIDERMGPPGFAVSSEDAFKNPNGSPIYNTLVTYQVRDIAEHAVAFLNDLGEFEV